jgi:serine/threonine protein kinase
LKSDIFSLGVIFYYLLEGKLPFALDDFGITESWMILKKIKRGLPKLKANGNLKEVENLI